MLGQVIFLGYVANALIFAVLALLLVTSWKGRLQGGLLVAAVLSTVLWSATMATHAYVQSFDARWVLLTEVLRDGAWILFLLRLLVDDLGSRRALLQIAVLGAITLASVWAIVGVSRGDALWNVPKPLILLLVCLAVNGVLLIEQLYRNAQPEYRWRIKFLCLGLGSVMIFDLYTYSDALLVQSLDSTLWWSRGVLNAIVAPLLMVSAARNPSWSLDVFVSRKVVFHSFTLIGVGVYLLVMAFVGYSIKLQGGVWGQTLQIVFLFGAALLLLLVMLSGQIRATLRVFLSKHFYNYKYDYREEWLRLTRTLAGSQDSAGLETRAVVCIAQILESRGGFLFLNANEGELVATAGWRTDPPAASVETASELVRFVMRTHWIVNVKELEAQAAYTGMILPPALLEVKDLWLIVPLFHDDRLLGFVGLLDSTAPRNLNWEDYDLLKTASHQVASDIARSQAADELANAKQFEAYNRLSAFIMHDLKNVVGQLSLVVDNGKRLRENPEFVNDAFDTVENAVRRMKRLLNQLKRSNEMNLSSRVDLKSVIAQVVNERSLAEPAPKLRCEHEDVKVMGDPDRLSFVIGNVIQNAQDAAGGGGSVDVVLAIDVSDVTVTVSDNGAGMSETFVREHLFKPFYSTKGESGMGIGAYEAKEYVETLGGHMSVRSEPGNGTVVTMRFPRVHTDTVERVA